MSPPELAQPRPDPPRPGPGGAGILIVEDEPELVRALRINLRARQYQVRTAGTGREALALATVWGPGFGQRTNYLRFHMARLRRKLEDNPARPRHLLTEPGMGYRYQP